LTTSKSGQITLDIQDPSPATNETGFTALPNGNRFNGGVFFSVSYEGFWRSSSEIEGYVDSVWGRNLTFGNNIISIFVEYTKSGFSVRCVKD